MAIRLAPAEVVSKVLCGWVKDHPAIKRWGILEQCCREERLPVIDVVRCESRDNYRHQLAVVSKCANNNTEQHKIYFNKNWQYSSYVGHNTQKQ